MKITMLGALGAVLLCPYVAVADPYPTCTDAYNEGHNVVANFVSASYNKAKCNRNTASQYEGFLTSILPTYLAAFGRNTTAANGACLLQGSFETWLDTIEAKYLECSSSPDFQAVQFRLLGGIAGSLLREFYWNATAYYTSDEVARIFAFPYEGMAFTGTPAECEAEIRTSTLGLPIELSNTLVATVCQHNQEAMGNR